MNEIHDKSILVVDDDPGLLRALTKVLRGEGAVVSLAEWAGDALDVLTPREKRIDLVITDVRLPFVTGMTLLYAIHKIFPALPVIVLTAFSAADLEVACLDQGAAAFLEKPVDAAQLIAAIESVLARQAPRDAAPSPPSAPPLEDTAPRSPKSAAPGSPGSGPAPGPGPNQYTAGDRGEAPSAASTLLPAFPLRSDRSGWNRPSSVGKTICSTAGFVIGATGVDCVLVS